jgi:hypothetical protein
LNKNNKKYLLIADEEQKAGKDIKEFDKKYPKVLSEASLDEILEKLKKRGK